MFKFNAGLGFIAGWFIAGPALAQAPKGPSTVLECAKLTPGFGLGHDGRDPSGPRQGWVTTVPDPDCDYFKLAYPRGLLWGALFITAGPPVDVGRKTFDYSGHEYVTVEMRGEQGGELVFIGLKTDRDPNDGSESKAPVSGLTPSWRWYTFPLSRFPPVRTGETLADRLKSLYVVTELVFDGPVAQTVYLRRVQFGPLTPTISSVVNAASQLKDQPVAPGSLVSIYGADLGPPKGITCGPDQAGLVPTTCNGTRVFFDENPAPILYSSHNQINAQVPFALTTGSKTKPRVIYNGRTGIGQDLDVRGANPGIFADDAGGQAIALNYDQNKVNTRDSPAGRGENIVFYVTGEGATTPSAVTGQVCLPGQLRRPVLQPVVVFVGGKEAIPEYAGCAPGYVGVMQLNVRIPSDSPTGLVSLAITVGGARSQPGVQIAVQ